MRPKRASSWNISVIGVPAACAARRMRISSGSFFPVPLGLLVTLRMPFVRCQLAPAVSMQQVVYRRQRHRTPKRGFQRRLELGHHQDAAGPGTLQERLQHFRFLLAREVRMVPTATRRRIVRADHLAAHERVAQATRPTHRHPDALCRRRQAQALQRQHDRLRLPKLFHRLRFRNHLPRPRHHLLPFCGSGHVAHHAQPRWLHYYPIDVETESAPIRVPSPNR